jgi:hypothetical protein
MDGTHLPEAGKMAPSAARVEGGRKRLRRGLVASLEGDDVWRRCRGIQSRGSLSFAHAKDDSEDDPCNFSKNIIIIITTDHCISTCYESLPN